MRKKYTFSVLRYVHDVITGEFQNIGLVMYSPDDNFLKTAFSSKHSRLSKCFPGLKVRDFKKMTLFVEKSFLDLEETFKNEFSFGKVPKSILEVTKTVLPFDDSSFQFSAEGIGMTTNLEKTFSDLFEQYVEKYYVERQWKHKRTDNDVWKAFKKPFEQTGLTFEPLTVKSDESEFEFPHVAFNGRPHIFQPISLDLSDKKHIFEKAHLWFGVSMDLLDPEGNEKVPKNLKLHFMLGMPDDPSLKDEFNRAKKLLDKVSCDHEIVLEDQAGTFAKKIKKEFEHH